LYGKAACGPGTIFLAMSLKKIWRKLRRQSPRPAALSVRPLREDAMREADAIITTNEVCDRHGTGVILRRIFGASSNVLSIRSSRLYPEHLLGQEQLCFDHNGLSRTEGFTNVLRILNGNTVRRILCVPFLPDELVTALVIKEAFNVPLCVFVMDDNNIHAHGIPDSLMQEALQKASLRLAISPELRDAYEQKYQLKFWVVPPVVDPQVLRTEPKLPDGPQAHAKTAVMIGSIWSRAWLNLLRRTIRESGLKVDWYGNAKASWLKVTSAQLEQDGITDCGFLPEAELTGKVKEYLYALVPSGTLDSQDDRPEIAQLSLPTRMPYLLAACNTPVIVLGSAQTAAARFLSRFEFGTVCPYDATALQETVQRLCQPKEQMRYRRTAAQHSKLFAATGLADWIWDALDRGEPKDQRFETAFSRRDGQFLTYIDPPVPKELQGDFALVYHAFRRLRNHGFAPDFVMDVGASTGVWSHAAKRIFPAPRFILVDPLHSQYVGLNKWYFHANPDFEAVTAAVSDRPGEAEFKVSDDLYGSSLLHPGDHRPYETIRVPVLTLDQIAVEKKITGRGLLKIDVQFAEHLVLAGAREFINQVDALVLELSLFRYAPEALLFGEMFDLVRSLGFHYCEDIGGWRSPVDGTTLQKDVLFVREHLLIRGPLEPACSEAVLTEAEPALVPQSVPMSAEALPVVTMPQVNSF
jgi:FkbM family methyltransferase